MTTGVRRVVVPMPTPTPAWTPMLIRIARPANSEPTDSVLMSHVLDVFVESTYCPETATLVDGLPKRSPDPDLERSTCYYNFHWRLKQRYTTAEFVQENGEWVCQDIDECALMQWFDALRRSRNS